MSNIHILKENDKMQMQNPIEDLRL